MLRNFLKNDYPYEDLKMNKNGYIYYLSNLLEIFTNKNFKGWGRKKTGRFAEWCYNKFGGKYTLYEDGFIRSIGLGIDNSPSFSLIEDDIGIYYDATRPSKLENILNTYDFTADPHLLQTANEAMNLMREQFISKYNNAPHINDDFFKADKKQKILIVAQTEGDTSLEYGLARQFSTQQIIADALRENPDASIYIKIHPDVLSGKKSSDIKIEDIPMESKVINIDVNPISLLKHFNKVYTKTSGMGMEALILGKEVHCYGMPYYAGWGLTKDRERCKRRTRKLTLEELFAGTYILYTRYYNPYKNRKSDIIDTIKEIRGLK